MQIHHWKHKLRSVHAQRFGAFISSDAGHPILELFKKNKKNCKSMSKLRSLGHVATCCPKPQNGVVFSSNHYCPFYFPSPMEPHFHGRPGHHLYDSLVALRVSLPTTIQSTSVLSQSYVQETNFLHQNQLGSGSGAC